MLNVPVANSVPPTTKHILDGLVVTRVPPVTPPVEILQNALLRRVKQRFAAAVRALVGALVGDMRRRLK
jgi:hypothetical protein